MSWDPTGYEAFRDARQQPLLDLLARLPERAADPVRTVVDAGCGTGRTTRLLAKRFAADVTGVDASVHMLAVALPAPRVTYVQADVATWRPAKPVDLVVANAVLHWLPDPETVLRHVASWVAGRGTLAVQVPANFDAPSHLIVREVASAAGWRDRLAGVVPGDHILPRTEYRALLEAGGFTVEAWDETYRHELPGEDAVLRWVSGTTLRPYLAALAKRDQRAFLDALRQPLADAYPAANGVTRFDFTRRFVVATRAAPRPG